MLRVRVTPRSSRNAVSGWRDETLLVRLTAPPVDGAANLALIRFLARELDLPLAEITVEAGERGREKLIGLPERMLEEVRRRWPKEEKGP